MKKIVFIIIFSILFLSQYRFQDMSKYQSDKKTVEVKGEVLQPGIYEVPQDATIEEVLKLAEPIENTADLGAINQSINIENHGVIVVPKIQEAKKISINSGTIEELDLLPGIGEKVAQRIIDYRDMTPFVTIEDLKKVKGIGDKVFEKIKDQITL